MKLIKLVKDIISPKKCYSCKKEGYFLCSSCLKTFVNYKPYCYICKNLSDNFLIHRFCRKKIYIEKIIILSHYKNNIIKKLIKDSKYYYKKDILEDFSIYLSQLLKKNEEIQNKKDYIIIPVPMYFLKKIYRGYNQSEILAKNIGNILGININNNLIKKIKNTRQQSKLSKQKRLRNLDKAFKINKNKMDNLDKINFILIDDIVSTGTTLNKIAKLLKQNGAKRIIGLAIASD